MTDIIAVNKLRLPHTDALLARESAIEECAKVAEEYPSPMNDLPMALAMRAVATAIRALKE